MQVASWLVVVSLLGAVGPTEPIVLDNASREPFTYRLYYGFQFQVVKKEPWTAPATIPGGERRTLGSPVPLVIGYLDKGEWSTFELTPGNRFVYRPDDRGHARLYSLGEARPQEKLREVNVLAVADVEYRDRFPEWQQRARDVIAGASRYYECEFGLRFTPIAYRPWEFNARLQRSREEKLASLKKIELGKADLVIAFVRSIEPSNNGMTLAWGSWLSPYVLLTDSWPELAYVLPLAHREAIWRQPLFGPTLVLAHELGHTFGAFHVDNPESVMQPAVNRLIPPRIQFDEVTREVVLATRDFDFRRGPDSVPYEIAVRVRQLYRAHHLPAESINADPITSAYKTRADLATFSQDRPLAEQMAQRASIWWRERSPLQYSAGYPGGPPRATPMPTLTPTQP